MACLALPAFAQVETVVVTARPPDPVGNAAFSVVSLTKSDLTTSNQLDSALEQVPGLSLFRRDSSLSANPTTQGVSLRSIAPSGAGRALVTLDGVPQNDPFGGWVIWSSLPAEDVAGAEIVRGAGAGPYGAGALTGVIALDEQSGDGVAAADVSYGSENTQRAAFAGGAGSDRIHFFGSASYESSDGWIPVSPAQRGAADDADTLVARNASFGVNVTPDSGTTVAARMGVYDEQRDSGLVGATSEASGTTGSLTIAHPQSGNTLGWRVQAWVRDTNFSNVSTSIAAGRVSTTPSNNQYATPALGWGGNAALRGGDRLLNWEVGVDLREAVGESREQYNFVSRAFTMNRVSGGRSVVGGVYAEGASRFGGWLLTLGLRADQWASTGGHLIQSVIATGATTLNQRMPSRSGVVPTARAGVRRDFDDYYLRAAAYEGFRAPSLNELYRPFRLGNNVTLANPDLKPEQLYGAEVGAGQDNGALSWDADVFANELHRAVTNVTLAGCPANFPCSLPGPGGSLIQRQNAGDIDAYGLEVDSRYRLSEEVSLRAALDYVDATVHGGTQAPQLTGKRPAQAPRWTITGGIEATPLDRLTLSADVRWESQRFSDDQNTMPLSAAATVDAKITWSLAPQWQLYLAADNLFNQRVATTASAGAGGLVYSYAAPFTIGGGLRFTR
jgi:outer membrane receptor protein involved in Fe transport